MQGPGEPLAYSPRTGQFRTYSIPLGSIAQDWGNLDQSTILRFFVPKNRGKKG